LALENIAKSQEAQKTSQDKRHNVLIEPLAIGTKVMVKNDDKLVKKLEARYRGPYTVVSVTKDHNYLLKDVLGAHLERSIPLHKLKVVVLEDKDKPQFEEFHKILSHRFVNNKIQYSVAWKQKPGEKRVQVSWVNPEDFANKKFINDYHNHVNQVKANARVTRSRGKLMGNINSLYFSIVMFLFIFPLIGAVTPLNIMPLRPTDQITSKGDFDFCEFKNNLNPIDLDDICTKPNSIDDNSSLILDWLKTNYDEKFFNSSADTSKSYLKTETFYHFKASLLSKSINQVSGKAFQCKKVTYIRSWSVGFWGKNYKNDEIFNEVLDPDTCWYMVKNKKCDKNIMTCDENENCRYETFPPDEFSWFSDSTKTFSHCYVSPRIIAESNINSHIFTSNCKVSDWSCLLKDSIVVWHRDVVQACGFKRISVGNFDAAGTILMEKTQKLGLQVKRIESHCDSNFIYTTEGLYLAPITKKLPIIDTFESFADTRGLMDLALADEDYRALELINDEKMILNRECNLFLVILKLFSKANDEYLRVKDFRNNELILYTFAGQIYQPKCVKVDTIRVTKMVKCFKDIPIQFYLNKYIENGFLTKDRIIKAHSDLSICQNVPLFVKIPKVNKTLISFHGESNLWDTKDVTFAKFDFYDQITYKNYSHIDGLVNGVDIIGQMHNLSVVTENGNQWLVIADENSKKEGFGYIFNRIWEWVIDWSWYILKRIFFLLLMIIFGYFMVKIFFIVLKNCLKKRRNNQLTSLRAALGINRNIEETSFISPLNETLPQAPIPIQGALPVIQPIQPNIVSNPVLELPIIKTIDDCDSIMAITYKYLI